MNGKDGSDGVVYRVTKKRLKNDLHMKRISVLHHLLLASYSSLFLLMNSYTSMQAAPQIHDLPVVEREPISVGGLIHQDYLCAHTL